MSKNLWLAVSLIVILCCGSLALAQNTRGADEHRGRHAGGRSTRRHRRHRTGAMRGKTRPGGGYVTDNMNNNRSGIWNPTTGTSNNPDAGKRSRRPR
jgi:hypothetical protein